MKPLILPVFLSHVDCPHRCLFCNQKATAAGGPASSFLRTFIEASLQRLPPNQRNGERQVAFYGGSFTAMSPEDQRSYLLEVQPFLAAGTIDSIRISTRPDALGEEQLASLREHGVKTVEIGVQSMIDEVLVLSKRGHCAADSFSALSRLKQWHFEVGVQLMIGLPGDTLERFLQTLDEVIALRPDFVRIHPTLVLKGAPLEALWRSGGYSPLPMEEAIQWLKRGVLKLEKTPVSIARIGLQPTRELENHYLAGPYHPSINQCVRSAIALDMAVHLLLANGKQTKAFFLCHPKEISNVRGQRNENLLKLKEWFGIKEFDIRASDEVPRDCLVLQTPDGERSMQRKDLQ